jgi:hypothetical protein
MKFDVTIEQANLILQALAKMPFEVVYQLVGDLQKQAESQIKESVPVVEVKEE